MRELSLNILDIAQNSIVAGATLTEIVVNENTKEKTLLIGIYDPRKVSEQKLKHCLKQIALILHPLVI